MLDTRTLRFGVVSDVSLGDDNVYTGPIGENLTAFSEDFLRGFVGKMEEIGPGFVVQLGDLIRPGKTLFADVINYNTGVAILNRYPTCHVIGDQDMIHIPETVLGGILRVSKLYYSFDIKGYHFVVLYPQFHQVYAQQPACLLDQIEWLRFDLADTKNPTIIFSHYSFADQDLTGNPWAERNFPNCLVAERKNIRQIFEDSGKVILAINGHLHWNHVDIHEGIPYVTFQSLVGAIDEKGTPTGTYGVVTLGERTIKIEVFGNQQETQEFIVRFKRQGDIPL